MSNSSVTGDDDLAAGATVESGETVDSATADREAAFDNPVRSAAGNVTGEDAIVASPPEDSTVESGDAVDSATADREAAFDDPVSSAAGTVTGGDAVVGPPEHSTVDETTFDPDRDTSQAADVAAGYDDENPDRG